jgi:hypothetical protein
MLRLNEQERAWALNRLKELSKDVDYHNVHYFKLKTDLLVAIGFATGNGYAECFRCKTKDVQLLDIDHVLGNGDEERKKFPNYTDYYIHILEEVLNGSKDYQILCKKCHSLKHHSK